MGRLASNLALVLWPVLFLYEILFSDPQRETGVLFTFISLWVNCAFFLLTCWPGFIALLSRHPWEKYRQFLFPTFDSIWDYIIGIVTYQWFFSFVCLIVGFVLGFDELISPGIIWSEFLCRFLLTFVHLPPMLKVLEHVGNLRPQPRRNPRRRPPPKPPHVDFMAPDDAWYLQEATSIRYKSLHLSSYAAEYAALVQSNPHLWLLDGPTPLFGTAPPSDVGSPLGLYADVTATSPSDLFRFPSTFLADGAPDIPVVFDTGASISLSPDANDFVSWDDDVSPPPPLGSITSQVAVARQGRVRWWFRDDRGLRHSVETPAYHVPEAKLRLFSPQAYLRDVGSGSFTVNTDGAVFRFPHSKAQLTFRLGPNPLPVGMAAAQRSQQPPKPGESSGFLSVVTEANRNLSSAQKELLAWHLQYATKNVIMN